MSEINAAGTGGETPMDCEAYNQKAWNASGTPFGTENKVTFYGWNVSVPTKGYRYTPQPDITVHELALLLPVFWVHHLSLSDSFFAENSCLGRHFTPIE